MDVLCLLPPAMLCARTNFPPVSLPAEASAPILKNVAASNAPIRVPSNFPDVIAPEIAPPAMTAVQAVVELTAPNQHSAAPPETIATAIATTECLSHYWRCSGLIVSFAL